MGRGDRGKGEKVGMHQISGQIIRPFLYPVSAGYVGWIPDTSARYPVIKKDGYAAKYAT